MIDFPNASTLSYSEENRFFGAGFRYGKIQKFSINGFILDLGNTDGSSGILNQINDYLGTLEDYQEIFVNGVSYGSGRLMSIDFQEGDWIELAPYTASFEVIGSGDLSLMTSQYYSGAKTALESYKAQFLDNFSESFSFNKQEDGGYEFVHSIALQARSGAGIAPIEICRGIASGLFETQPSFGFWPQEFAEKYSLVTGKRYFSESYNLFSNECSFQKRFSLNRPQGNYSSIYNHSLAIDENGIATITENGSIVGLVEPRYNSAAQGFTNEISGAFARASGVFSSYIPQTSYPLKSTPTQITRKGDTFSNSVEYSVTFTNDPKINDGYSWSYEHSVETDDKGISTVTENGNVVGYGKAFADKYPKALVGYNSIKVGIVGRISQFFSVVGGAGTLSLVSRSESKDEGAGSISYSYAMSNDKAYQNSCGVKKVTIQVDDAKGVFIMNKYAVFGGQSFDGKEIAQPAGNSSQNSLSASITVEGFKGQTVSTLLTCAKNVANSLVPSNADAYLDSCNYSYSLETNSIVLSVAWRSASAKVKGNVTIT